MGEYVAAAKAIVTEPIPAVLPGDFQEGSHYLTFTSAEECVAAVDRLVRNPALLENIQNANYRYYQNYLKPDVMIRNTLKIADGCDPA